MKWKRVQATYFFYLFSIVLGPFFFSPKSSFFCVQFLSPVCCVFFFPVYAASLRFSRRASPPITINCLISFVSLNCHHPQCHLYPFCLSISPSPSSFSPCSRSPSPFSLNHRCHQHLHLFFFAIITSICVLHLLNFYCWCRCCGCCSSVLINTGRLPAEARHQKEGDSSSFFSGQALDLLLHRCSPLC